MTSRPPVLSPEQRKQETVAGKAASRSDTPGAAGKGQREGASPLAGNAPKSDNRRRIHGSAAPSGADSREMVLARFIRFCSSVMAAPVSQEAAALMVNRISELIRVDRAVLVRLKGKQSILAVTNGGAAAQDSAFADAIDTLKRRYGDRPKAVVVPRVAPEKKAVAPHLWQVQQAMGGTQILWLPLWLSHDQGQPPGYALWLERWQEHRWDKPDIELLQHAALFLGHGLARPRKATRSKKRFIRMAVALALLVFLGLPVTSSVTAPVRVMPDQPHHIFAPMDGILKELRVRPGQWVDKGDLLFRYDARVLDKRLDEAYRNISVARARLVRLQGAAHRDPEARAELPVQELEVARAEAEAAFFVKQRDRADVRTGQPGVIVLDDPDALIGTVLQTGQAVMSVADPSRTKVRMMVPASDVGFLKKGERVAVRLDSNPFQSFSALITRVGFEVRVSENGVPSVLTEAIWLGDGPDVQPGQKGSAKIFGASTYMGIQILRKPFIHLRALTGL